MSLIVDEHRQYLSDRSRLDFFAKAIEAIVQPGHTVLDLASGTGVLGLMACRAGAERVYSVEVGGMIEVARQVARDNGMADRIQFIKGLSTHISLPERVDVVVADQIGNFGFNAGVLEYFEDARKRFLKPGGITIPSRLDLWLCPIQSSAFFAQIEFWDTMPGGFDFGSTRLLAANTGYQVDMTPESLIAEPVRLASIDLNNATTGVIHGKVLATVRREGILHGLAGWFDVELAPDIRMTNGPASPNRIQRRQIYFPIEQPVKVEETDQIRASMSIRPRESLVNWTVEIVAARTSTRKGLFRHSTWKGMLHNHEDLVRTRPDFVPVLEDRGLARRTVVELCDGNRTVRNIEEAVLARHPELFTSPSEAGEFVAEVITRYAKVP